LKYDRFALDEEGLRGGNGLRLDHIGIVVENLDNALHFFTETLKATVLSRKENSGGRALDIAFVETDGTVYELMHPHGPDTNFYTFLNEHGPGLHHIAFSVGEIGQATEQLVEFGVGLEGGVNVNEERFMQWLDPKTTLGIGMQLIQRRS